jgi:hypothetical protein
MAGRVMAPPQQSSVPESERPHSPVGNIPRLGAPSILCRKSENLFEKLNDRTFYVALRPALALAWALPNRQTCHVCTHCINMLGGAQNLSQ